MRTGIYVRISKDDEGSGQGVDRQERDCREMAERNGWIVSEVYSDNDKSAYSGAPRPAYEKLMTDIEVGALDAVVVWHPDRLHRRPLGLEHFIERIERTGCQVATVTAGDWDLSTPEGRLTARITGSVARKESEDKSRRLRRKHLQLARDGRPGGGPRAFGYETDKLTLRPEEAALIREAADRVLAGEKLYAVATDWNARGIQTVRGAQWSTMAIKTFLTSPRIAGLREHRVSGSSDAPERYEAVWEPVLPVEEWERVGRVLEARSRRRERPARSYLLSGLIKPGSTDRRVDRC